jgi:hypothetical protein
VLGTDSARRASVHPVPATGGFLALPPREVGSRVSRKSSVRQCLS